MALGKIRTNWQSGEIVTPEELNRIEGNAEAGAKPNSLLHFYTVSVALTTVFAAPAGYAANFTSQTGRVLISSAVSFQNTSGAQREMQVALHVGVKKTPTLSVVQSAYSFETAHALYYAFVPVGVPISIGPMAKANGGGITIIRSNLTILDV